MEVEGLLPEGHGVTGENAYTWTGAEVRCTPLIDVADSTDLAAACLEEGRAIAAPPRLGAAGGVPVNPLAIR